MWRRTYLLLLLVRVYFAFSPSYIHPDENFQGPEVFAGQVFSYPSHRTWEFTSDHPIRSVFPLWIVYGLPMTLLKWLWAEAGTGSTPTDLIYYVLRGGMFLLSFVLEDWAMHELVSSPRHRRQAVVLVASSYVTWTYQSHTFSNSLETLLVAWGLVLIQRILENKQHSSIFACAILSFVLVTGVFNRITFPAFVLIPGLKLVPHFLNKPLSLLAVITFGFISCLIAISIDTAFYSASPTSLTSILRKPIITPLNNLLYNSTTSNLANHGLHPRYTHVLINLPQLLGPIYLLLFYSFKSPSTSYFSLRNLRAISSLSATAILSIFPHQESRFLIPCIPLLLTCFHPPRSRLFLISWVLFNAALGTLMGIYHQGGVIPVQLQIPTILANSTAPPPHSLARNTGSPPMPNGTATVFWWKTYSPPTWLLGDLSVSNATGVPPLSFSNISTVDLMGIPGLDMMQRLEQAVPKCEQWHSSPTQKREQEHAQNSIGTHKVAINYDNPVLLVAPNSNTFLDKYVNNYGSGHADTTTDTATDRIADPQSLQLLLLWSHARHVSLDDMDFGEDGVIATLRRVIGRRGLNVWLVGRGVCLGWN
ncbi:glycosylphosphatidylinositol-alpha 1,2 mannosyltransferase [Paracoccidioides brasiliensis Pb18]|uniref:Mannosyltransferase n=1 Tax=Paracoccidioides brasiliensis (strain Pb18) TaxID=502780 RepID=C1GF02_PARBD|nr:glycosylphosphatidylinositol-alpha 1,2 mannosyltransferase [Paracoccidioides brasiliensis Pb18]EEH49759.2 hypothetical protein PADG_05838 [Paracoccidioides brasiliensis Pb18]